MKKAVFLCTTILAFTVMTACKGGKATEQVSINDVSWLTIEEKLNSDISLDDDDCLFILSDTTLDDGQSEGVGNSLFRLMKGNMQVNELFTNAQKRVTPEAGNRGLNRLLELMSSDIVLEEYESYERFLADFPMFRGCQGAEVVFNEIMANGF